MEDEIMNSDELLIAIKDMFEKKTDELKSYVDEKIKGQSILIEGLRSDIKSVAEGHDLMNKQIDALEKKVDNKTNEIKEDIKVVTDYVIGVDAKLNEHEIILKRVK